MLQAQATVALPRPHRHMMKQRLPRGSLRCSGQQAQQLQVVVVVEVVEGRPGLVEAEGELQW